MSGVPPNIVAAATNAVPGIELTEAEIERTRNGIVYSVEGVADGSAYEVEIAADGRVIEVESEDDDSDSGEDSKE
ncbi:MAG: hypothetical protein O2923_01560 [Verrucomicrobia bacterium]|nr:hypothetical protein [Verrucomicrobiota bacterium]MDA1085697.1 hypothetical protein [Verrucomicrobiota bacterium]